MARNWMFGWEIVSNRNRFASNRSLVENPRVWTPSVSQENSSDVLEVYFTSQIWILVWWGLLIEKGRSILMFNFQPVH